MELRKDRFEAFKGNALIKSGSARSRSALGSKKSTYDFDELWRGSVNNLMSSENITEDLIKESIKELESAMQESKRMLSKRDAEIAQLRQYIENNKNQNGETEESLEIVKSQLEKSQRRIVELECELSELKIRNNREVEELKKQVPLRKPINCSGIIECTCYCGGSCKAARDLYETKKSFETVKQKYELLKRRVREFRKHAEENQKHVELHEEEKSVASCTIQ